MRERTTATIAIKKSGSTVITVPITEQCKRVFSLMNEDYITLEFNLRSAIHIGIGYYVEDEIFGKFVVTSEQMPKYDESTGGYSYSLKLEAEYMSWRNRKMMMTLDNDGVRVRKEAQWRITSDLETQVKEVIKNVEIIGYIGYSYDIESTASKASEVKQMEYDGTNIIEALNEIAEAWECEWWVRDKVIHFGKCEEEEDALTFEIGKNVESMNISDNRNVFANKVYVYGSTQNIPSTYRKELVLLTTNQDTKEGMNLWYIDKKLTPKMFPSVMPLYIKIDTIGSDVEYTGLTVGDRYDMSSVTIDYPSAYSLKAPSITFGACYIIPTISYLPSGTAISYTRKVEIVLVIGNTEQVISENSISGTTTNSGGSIKGFPIHSIEMPAVNIPSIQLPIGDVSIYVKHTITNTQYNMGGIYPFTISSKEDMYLTIEALGTGVIKVFKKGVIQSSETKTWTNGRYYTTGSTLPVLDMLGSAVYKLSSSTSMQEGKTYKANLTVEKGIAAVVFFDENGNVVGWIDGKGAAADYSWNESEHVDASSFKLTTSANDQGQLQIASRSTLWNAYARINAIGAALGEDDSYTLTFCSQDGVVSQDAVPTNLAVGDRIVVDEESLTIRVPSAFFSTEFDNPSALSAIGEKRLQMPIDTHGYLMLDGANESNAVEEVVVFEDIYPRCDLVVDSIEEHNRTDKTEYEGEDETSNWQWIEYTLKLKKANGDAFPFSDEYMLPGANLKIKFLTDEEMQGVSGYESTENGCKLAGMSFDVDFRKSGEYIIGRNDEYGAMLPNDTLRPSVGDPCILIGWNTRAIGGLGLITDAEEKLQEKGEAYVDALEEGQFTFECTMMSDFMFDQIPYLRLFDSEDKRVKDSQDAYIWVKNGHDAYMVPTEGVKVTIKHGALAKNKQSRIIGYEMKLDKPYHSPIYIVGETEAYSKLAKIERELKRIG